MKKAVALLRGINVGKAKRVAMADLRALVEALGYRDVRTLLNSGNVVFGLPAKGGGDPARRIEEALTAKLGVSARVLVVSGKALSAAVEGDPFEGVATDPSRYLVTFVSDPALLAKLEPLAARDWSPDALRLGEGVVYTWSVKGILESEVVKAMNKVLGDGATSRNWATVLKLHSMLGEGSS